MIPEDAERDLAEADADLVTARYLRTSARSLPWWSRRRWVLMRRAERTALRGIRTIARSRAIEAYLEDRSL